MGCLVWGIYATPLLFLVICCCSATGSAPTPGCCVLDEQFPVHCQLHFLVFGKQGSPELVMGLCVLPGHKNLSVSPLKDLNPFLPLPLSLRNPTGLLTESLRGRDTYCTLSSGDRRRNPFSQPSSRKVRWWKERCCLEKASLKK